MKESVLRTVVPILYALLVRYGVVNWLGVDDATAQTLITMAVSGLIYVGLRFAETHQAAFGWLLGYASQPKYAQGRGTRMIRKKTEAGHVAGPYGGWVIIAIAVMVFLILLIVAGVIKM